jgi:hypothetical protein
MSAVKIHFKSGKTITVKENTTPFDEIERMVALSRKNNSAVRIEGHRTNLQDKDRVVAFYGNDVDILEQLPD